MKIGVFYGSETGNTRNHAFDIANCFSDYGWEVGDPKDVAILDMGFYKDYDFMVFGSPTWNIGELQADLDAMIKDFNKIDLTKKVVAIYGCGDQEGYPNTYQDAIGILADFFTDTGANLIGKTSSKEHQFKFSKAFRNGEFLGLALDNHNQADLSLKRIHDWVKQLVIEIKKFSNS